MRTIETTIEIEAPSDRVWQVFADTAAWPEWNPFIRRLEGTFERGAVLEVTIQPPGRGAMRLKPLVIEAEPGRLCWRGGSGCAGSSMGSTRSWWSRCRGGARAFVTVRRSAVCWCRWWAGSWRIRGAVSRR